MNFISRIIMRIKLHISVKRFFKDFEGFTDYINSFGDVTEMAEVALLKSNVASYYNEAANNAEFILNMLDYYEIYAPLNPDADKMIIRKALVETTTQILMKNLACTGLAAPVDGDSNEG